ncbi:multidrug transporter [Fusarium pseudocircinatum]|uniref:Multidrug transporter n=1 Tax=Fusarium pseudocircinatum TaxID=56676 RepID=A0A8H5NY72_9HYPO|nr:multidrug transporter [Fusarium pseudocircinatum]
MGLMLLLDDHTETYKWVLISLTGGLGLGILYSAQAFAAQASALNSDLPFAAIFYAFCRSLVQGIGVAVGGVIFQNEFRKQVETSPGFASKASEWVKDASALVQILKRSPSSMQLMKETIIDGYIKGLQTVWLVLALLACLAFLVSLVCVKAKSLDRKLETEHALDQADLKEKKDPRVSKLMFDK